jgi:hypothetical protein
MNGKFVYWDKPPTLDRMTGHAGVCLIADVLGTSNSRYSLVTGWLLLMPMKGKTMLKHEKQKTIGQLIDDPRFTPQG